MGKIKIVYVKVGDLKLAPYNPRTMDDAERQRLEAVLAESGFVENLVVNRATGHVVGGNQRLISARSMGIKEVPVVYVDLTLEQEKALNIALNKISGDWDEPALQELMLELEQADLNMELTGYSEDEIQELLGRFDVDEINAPELSDAGEPEFRQVTFTVNESQFQTIQAAIKKAKSDGDFQGDNDNANGNAVHRIAEKYLGPG